MPAPACRAVKPAVSARAWRPPAGPALDSPCSANSSAGVMPLVMLFPVVVTVRAPCLLSVSGLSRVSACSRAGQRGPPRPISAGSAPVARHEPRSRRQVLGRSWNPVRELLCLPATGHAGGSSRRGLPLGEGVVIGDTGAAGIPPATLRLVAGPVELVFIEPGGRRPVVERGALESVVGGAFLPVGAAWRRLVPPGVEQRYDRLPQLWADSERFAADDPPQRGRRDSGRGGHARAGVPHRDQGAEPPHGRAGRGPHAANVSLADRQEPGGDVGLHRGAAGVGAAVHGHGPGAGGAADRLVGASGRAELQYVLADRRGADPGHDASTSRCRLAGSGVVVSGSASKGRSVWRRAEARVRAISGSSSPVLRAASASSPRSVSPASRARLAAQNRPSFRFPPGWRAIHSASRWASAVLSSDGCGRCCGSGSSSLVTAAQSSPPCPSARLISS